MGTFFLVSFVGVKISGSGSLELGFSTKTSELTSPCLTAELDSSLKTAELGYTTGTAELGTANQEN